LLAALSSKFGVVSMLISHGCDVAKKSTDGFNLKQLISQSEDDDLSRAFKSGQQMMLEVLLEDLSFAKENGKVGIAENILKALVWNPPSAAAFDNDLHSRLIIDAYTLLNDLSMDKDETFDEIELLSQLQASSCTIMIRIV
jgi:hypothetical protein